MPDSENQRKDEPKKPVRKVRKLFRAVVRILIFTYIGFMVLLYLFQSRFIYFPDRKIEMTPDDMGLPYESVEIATSDGVKITGWFVPADNARGTLLFFHGNAGNISHRLDSLRIFNDLGLNTLIIDYRGYGQSEGKPSEDGTYLDAEAAWQYLVEQRGIEPGKIIIFGRSLGGAVAVNLAGKRKPEALIIESTCTSVSQMGSEIYPFLPRFLISLLSHYKYDAQKDITKVTCPVLVVHSRDDEMIPFAHGEAIFEAAGEPKEFLEITGSHNDGYISSGRTYKEGLDRFISGHPGKATGRRGRGVFGHLPAGSLKVVQ